MSIRHILLTALLLPTALLACAQGNREKVELLVDDGSTAIFCSEGFADNKKDAVDNACMAVLRKLLYDGVDSFNGSAPIVVTGQDTNIWLKEFFTGKYAAYRQFIGAVELVGDFNAAPTGETHCCANVIIKYEQLMDQARIQGLTGEQGGSTSTARQPATPATQPVTQPGSQRQGTWHKRNF